jgi:hypothetical protein
MAVVALADERPQLHDTIGCVGNHIGCEVTRWTRQFSRRNRLDIVNALSLFW